MGWGNKKKEGGVKNAKKENQKKVNKKKEDKKKGESEPVKRDQTLQEQVYERATVHYTRARCALEAGKARGVEEWRKLPAEHQQATMAVAVALVLLIFSLLALRPRKSKAVSSAIDAHVSFAEAALPELPSQGVPESLDDLVKSLPEDGVLLDVTAGVEERDDLVAKERDDLMAKERGELSTSAASGADDEVKDPGETINVIAAAADAKEAASASPANDIVAAVVAVPPLSSEPGVEAPASPTATTLATPSPQASSPPAAAAAAVSSPAPASPVAAPITPSPPAAMERKASFLERLLPGRSSPPPPPMSAIGLEPPQPLTPVPAPEAAELPEPVKDAPALPPAPVEEAKEPEAEPEPAVAAVLAAVPGVAAPAPSLFERIASTMGKSSGSLVSSAEAAAAAHEEAAAKGTRASLADDFEVTFGEGAMGFSLEMDGRKNSVVTRVQTDSPAARAGVMEGDRVVAVGGKAATSFGTVLGYLNIAPRPVAIRFHKAALCDAGGNFLQSAAVATAADATAATDAAVLDTAAASTDDNYGAVSVADDLSIGTADDASNGGGIDNGVAAAQAAVAAAATAAKPTPLLLDDVSLMDDMHAVDAGMAPLAGASPVAGAGEGESAAAPALPRMGSQRVKAQRSNSFARLFGRKEKDYGADDDSLPAGTALRPQSPTASTVGGGSPGARRGSSRSRILAEFATADDAFDTQMVKGVVVTKYSRSGKGAQRTLFYDDDAAALAWGDPLAGRASYKRSNSLSRFVKGERETLPLASLLYIRGGDETDPTAPDTAAAATAAAAAAAIAGAGRDASPAVREESGAGTPVGGSGPALYGTAQLRMCCGGNEALLASSFAMVFAERSLEVTASSPDHMRILVRGFRDLQARHAGAALSPQVA